MGKALGILPSVRELAPEAPESIEALGQESPTSFEELMEWKFSRDVFAAVEAWRAAGKPYKR